LRERGAEPLSYPAYRLERFNDAAGWTRFLKLAASGGWCLFASETEVRFFSDALLRHKLDLRALGKFKIAAIGRNTESALGQRHIRADKYFRSKSSKPVPVNRSRAENLIVFSEEKPVDSRKWKEVLRLKLFRIKPASWESHWIQEVRDNPPDFILFRNAAEVDGLVAVLGQEAARDLSGKCTIVVADNSAKAASRRYGLRLATGSTMLGIVSLAQ
jgi:uroporphyrinogen-III synthase